MGKDKELSLGDVGKQGAIPKRRSIVAKPTISVGVEPTSDESDSSTGS